MKAYEWYKRGNDTSDPIESFANFWRGFNNLYANLSKGDERKKIQAFLNNRICETGALHILSTHADCIDYLLSEPVIDMRGNGKDTVRNITAFSATSNALIKLKEVVLVVYQVRCNLEHGQKSPNRERDVLLCSNAAPIIEELIKMELKNSAKTTTTR